MDEDDAPPPVAGSDVPRREGSGAQLMFAGLPPGQRGRRSARGRPSAETIGLPLPFVGQAGGFGVVRDDTLPGGTAARAIWPLMRESKFAEIVCAVAGGDPLQLAVAYWARCLGRRGTVFVGRQPEPHRLTLEAYRVGARVMQVAGDLAMVQADAEAYAADEGCLLVPTWLDTPVCLAAVASAARSLDLLPSEVWVAVTGRGAIARALQQAWPYARHVAVLVDPVAGCDVGQAEPIVEATEPAAPARVMPPFPAHPETAAKAWRHMQAKAAPGALLWNVA